MNWLAYILFAAALVCILADLCNSSVGYRKGSLFMVGFIFICLGAWCSNTYSKHSVNPGISSTAAERMCIKEDVQVFVVDDEGIQHTLKRCKQ